MTTLRLKLSAPWATFVNKIIALFKNDPEVAVTYDNDNCEVKIYVENAEKAEVLQWLLPTEKEFGDVTLFISVIPANKSTKALDLTHMKFSEMFNILFDKNPAYSFSRDIEGIFSNNLTYVVMTPAVVQFFNDNLNDIYGNMNTLYQEIAHDVFDADNLQGVVFCTDSLSKNLTVTQQNWP